MRILCFGDSNTYGYDPRSFLGDRYPAEDRWVDLLAARTGWEVINAGENGRAIPRNTHCLQPNRDTDSIDLLLVMLGTNDLLQGASAQEASARMEAFLSQLFPHYPRILLAAPPPMRRGAWVEEDALVEQSHRLAEEYETLSRKLSLPFVHCRDTAVELTFDGVHFTEQGHHTFASIIEKSIRFTLDSHPAS